MRFFVRFFKQNGSNVWDHLFYDVASHMFANASNVNRTPRHPHPIENIASSVLASGSDVDETPPPPTCDVASSCVQVQVASTTPHP